MTTQTPGRGRQPKEDLTTQLIASFKGLISQRVLIAGERLPAERDLAQRFGVSRSSLRHALKVLEVMGVIRQRVGDGTYLTGNASQVLSEPLEFLMLIDGISPDELLDFRMIVEPELAYRAAERATMAHINDLRSSLAKMERESDDEILKEADIAFHQTIFRASGVRVAERIFSLVMRSMLTSIGVTSQMVGWDHTLGFHRPIFDAIDTRKPDVARARMIDHLEDARALLRQAASKKRSKKSAPARIFPIARRSSKGS